MSWRTGRTEGWLPRQLTTRMPGRYKRGHVWSGAHDPTTPRYRLAAIANTCLSCGSLLLKRTCASGLEEQLSKPHVTHEWQACPDAGTLAGSLHDCCSRQDHCRGQHVAKEHLCAQPTELRTWRRFIRGKDQPESWDARGASPVTVMFYTHRLPRLTKGMSSQMALTLNLVKDQ